MLAEKVAYGLTDERLESEPLRSAEFHESLELLRRQLGRDAHGFHPCRCHTPPTRLCSVSGARGSRGSKQGPRNTYALDARTGGVVQVWDGIGTYSPLVADRNHVYLVGRAQVFGLEPKRVTQRSRTASR